MNDNGLSNVMSLIKKQKWKNLFKRRELMHTAACKEFYANLTVFIYKKKEIAKSRVKGVKIEFDSMKLASILDAPRHTVKDHELPYGDWMSMIFDAFGVPLVDKKGEEPKRYDYFEETFLTMCKLKREDGIWWIGTGENRRRDDDYEAPKEEVEEEEKDQTDFDWEGVDEAAVEGESRSDEQFYDAQVDVEEPITETLAAPEVVAQASVQQKETAVSGVDPSCPTGRIPEAVMNKLQAEFERARANRFQADLEKAKAENPRLLALLQQAQTKPKP
ncbi:hypothetical protein Dimus_007823 [Dionaea muscipula]